jgi:SIR2-like domain
MTFEEALPRLAATYDKGLLVPFLGAGMSRPACPDWAGLIAELERQCGMDPAGGAAGPADLVRRGNRAVRILKRKSSGDFHRALRKALYPSQVRPPDQTEALARTWWPMVLTTNYDDLFAQAYRRNFQEAGDALAVLGRSAQDCQQVLTSLSSTSGCILWALQGYLGRGSWSGPVRHLRAELVVGHEEYRRVTHTAQHFRRAFAEVFRRRSLLFLGSSLGDEYLLDLFGEILEFSGANPLPHYAMVRAGTVDAPFLRSRFNIIALEYERHEDLPRWLDALRETITGRRARPVRWTFSIDCSADRDDPAPCDDLEIVRGPLPDPGPGEVAAVSGGTDNHGNIWVGAPIYDFVARHWPPPARARGFAIPRAGPLYVRGFPAPDGGTIPVVAVVGRVEESDQRDLRVIGDAASELFDWAVEQGAQVVRMALLAAGRTAHFPAYFSLAETIRAFGRWRRRTGANLRLVIHLVNPGALFEVASGRLDVVELLTADDVRFWVEVLDEGQVLERELVFAPPERTVEQIVEQFELPVRGWMLEVRPQPRRDSRPLSVADARKMDLLEIGVIPGATLRFIAAADTRADR